ncbi:MAG TPA: D-sedoheptulose 7-phosphate isomerase [bacterium]|nr:D-sedoheptulose 7-phosphate isomerase [bacterium]
MKEQIQAELRDHIDFAKRLEEQCIPAIEKIAELFIETLANNKKILVCGNGGSAADAQHLAGEMLGRYKKNRASLPVMALSADASVMTCIGNDYSFDDIFSRQVEALAREGDLVVGITTSGNSPNVLKALQAAKKAGARTAALTGGDGGKVVAAADVVFLAPAKHTARIQETHITVIHIICRLIEERLF